MTLNGKILKLNMKDVSKLQKKGFQRLKLLIKKYASMFYDISAIIFKNVSKPGIYYLLLRIQTLSSHPEKSLIVYFKWF